MITPAQNRLDTLEQEIVAGHDYSLEYVSLLLGYPDKLVKRLIASGTLYAHKWTGRTKVTGDSLMQYVRYHRDSLEKYSRYSDRQSEVSGIVPPPKGDCLVSCFT